MGPDGLRTGMPSGHPVPLLSLPSPTAIPPAGQDGWDGTVAHWRPGSAPVPPRIRVWGGRGSSPPWRGRSLTGVAISARLPPAGSAGRGGPAPRCLPPAGHAVGRASPRRALPAPPPRFRGNPPLRGKEEAPEGVG